MDLHQLETFLAVVREGSFSGAAKGAGPHPAGDQPGHQPARRRGRPAAVRAPGRRGGLTDAGKTLVEYAERLIGVRQQALVALEDVRALRAGRLGIAANELTCLYLLPVLHEFRRLYPGVSVTVQRSLASRVPGSVLDYAVDMGVDHLRAGRARPALGRGLPRRAGVRRPARPPAGPARSTSASRCSATSRSSRITSLRPIGPGCWTPSAATA